MKTYLVTGGAGFIGTNFVKYMLAKYHNISMVVLDKLTYAGIKENIQKEIDTHKIKFIHGDICDIKLVDDIFQQYEIDYVVNFAAESHVDRSIENPKVFLETNILGTQTLLDAAKKFWTVGKDEKGYPIYKENKKYLQISTDEVYGSLKKDIPDGETLVFHDKELDILLKNRGKVKTFGKTFFTEYTPISPKSPYSTSKASADMLVMAYKETYHMPVNITRCSNNYGPYQFPEKLIPLIIGNILQGKTLPVYGDGMNIRDWLYVEDHCKAIDMVLEKGKLGEVYNVGGFNEEANIIIVKKIIDIISNIMKEETKYRKYLKTDIKNINYDLISFVQDRLGHDTRYAINPGKIVKELGWYPETTFLLGIEKTIRWYLEHTEIYQ
ncbi:dTDP-glucose 4,6-dehydratase [Fusobacterium necrophorum]|uniref:dTDP-glucose 4,6-dehydratase n=1 Tax=Fusobacterium necrophorum TaxID=859 RepID=UPI00087E6D73|nr:dTDP-glucose 4,6-dehydratase [Fusobacterium necrophorum]AYZ73077.1 dTDP-glucose 4,6-dehydratase [Fusobacterium necrophorum]AZW08926.1 dTDP-glucose 4,6-dehydratase [Fusobacterium necrophorum subsp. necrophorum]SDB41903.1 dTDP-glucose 4,6-dehydratase [Fusobacterium necrophorum]SQD09903.1 dTDP-glucose 4,6-dehydratase [Fusobacterium necrophorum subsp. necrophorum]